MPESAVESFGPNSPKCWAFHVPAEKSHSFCLDVSAVTPVFHRCWPFACGAPHCARCNTSRPWWRWSRSMQVSYGGWRGNCPHQYASVRPETPKHVKQLEVSLPKSEGHRVCSVFVLREKDPIWSVEAHVKPLRKTSLGRKSHSDHEFEVRFWNFSRLRQLAVVICEHG